MKKISGFISGICEMFQILWSSSKPMTMLILFNNLIRNAVWPIRALLVRNLVDIITLSNQFGFEQYQTEFWCNALLFFVLFLWNRIWWPLNSYAQTLMLAKIGNHAKNRIINVMERIHLSFFDYSENYDMYTRALSQTEDRQPINAVNNVISLVSLIISFLTAFFAMISINITVSIILICSSIPSVIWESKFNRKVYEFDQEATRERRLLDYISSLFFNKASSKEIRTFKIDSYLSEKHEKTLKEYNRKYFKLFNSKLGVDSLFWFILQIALVFGYYCIISDAAVGIIPLGSLSFFLAVAVDLQSSIKNFGNAFNNVVQSNKYFDNLTQFEKTNSITAVEAGKTPVPNTIESIEFKNVSFAYPNSDEYVLENISFVLKCPQSVVLVGDNGAGKTTLMKLLMRFYLPTTGEILINDIDIQKFNSIDYYKLFSVCFQDYMKYGFTLKENVMMANQYENDAFFDDIVRKTQMEEIIERLPKKEHTYLSKELDENAEELSGGQYNRIAIARALAKDAPIVLLDEPTAALDAKAEKNMFNLYSVLTQNKLGIMVTHRLSTAVEADMILVLKEGKLIESGTHLDLIKQDGEYATLFNMQAEHYI